LSSLLSNSMQSFEQLRKLHAWSCEKMLKRRNVREKITKIFLCL
jgi:hypothetical protein